MFDPDQDVDYAELAYHARCAECGGQPSDDVHADGCSLDPANRRFAITDTANLSAVLASDFSGSTADVLRGYWTAGKFRALAAVLPAGNRIILTTDRQTGATCLVELMGVQDGSHGGRVVVRHHYPEGHHDTAYRTREVGAAVIVPSGIKWAALDKHRELCAEAIALVRAQYGEADGQAWGRWHATLTANGARVRYEPLTGNPAFRDQWGQDLAADVWPDRDGTLTVWNVRKYPPRVLCDQPPAART